MGGWRGSYYHSIDVAESFLKVIKGGGDRKGIAQFIDSSLVLVD
jgi:hypothetical protein